MLRVIALSFAVLSTLSFAQDKNINITKQNITGKSFTKEVLQVGDVCYVLPSYDAQKQLVTATGMQDAFLDCYADTSYTYGIRRPIQTLYFNAKGDLVHKVETNNLETKQATYRATFRWDGQSKNSKWDALRQNAQRTWDAFIAEHKAFECPKE